MGALRSVKKQLRDKRKKESSWGLEKGKKIHEKLKGKKNHPNEESFGKMPDYPREEECSQQKESAVFIK